MLEQAVVHLVRERRSEEAQQHRRVPLAARRERGQPRQRDEERSTIQDTLTASPPVARRTWKVVSSGESAGTVSGVSGGGSLGVRAEPLQVYHELG